MSLDTNPRKRDIAHTIDEIVKIADNWIKYLKEKENAGRMTNALILGLIAGALELVSTVENGQFTHYLVDQGILLGKADAYNHDNDSVLGEPSDVVEEAFAWSKAYCTYQTPTISDSFPNDLLL
ncbi:MAG: hypothetical protein QXU11_11975 [Thermoproteota archaeon]